MPRETIHYGRKIATVTVPETKEYGAYAYETSLESAQKAIEYEGLDASRVTFSRKPNLDVLWQRPIDRMSLPAGEEAQGSVQVQVEWDAAELRSTLDYLTEHPDDIHGFTTFFTESLTRSQINHLIRTLKRARDAAYGSDE